MPSAESARPFTDLMAPLADEASPRQGRANPPAPPPALPGSDPGSAADRDQPAPFNAAVELVRSASEALERMRAHCREVEAFAEQEIEYHRAQLATADNVIRELDEKNAAHEETIRRLQAELDEEAEQRETAQRRLEELREAHEKTLEDLRRSEDRAAEAETWLAKLNTEIASAFSTLPSLAPEGPPGGREPKRRV